MLAARREGRTFFVEDESTFSLTPYTACGWYAKGEAARVVLENRPSDRFYAFGVSNGRKEHYRFFDGRRKKKTKRSKAKKSSIDTKKTLVFLRYLHSKYPKLLIIWDAASPHRSKRVQKYAAANNIKLLEFPTAIPDENPQEQAWNALKSAAGSTYHPDYQSYLKAVKRESRQKNLTEMFHYLCP